MLFSFRTISCPFEWSVQTYIGVLSSEDDNLVVLEEVGEEVFGTRTLGDSPAVVLVPCRVNQSVVKVDDECVGLLVGGGEGIGQEFVPDGLGDPLTCGVETLLGSAGVCGNNVLVRVLLGVTNTFFVRVWASYLIQRA